MSTDKFKEEEEYTEDGPRLSMTNLSQLLLHNLAHSTDAHLLESTLGTMLNRQPLTTGRSMLEQIVGVIAIVLVLRKEERVKIRILCGQVLLIVNPFLNQHLYYLRHSSLHQFYVIHHPYTILSPPTLTFIYYYYYRT